MYALSLDNQHGSAHLRWNLVPRPPGVPYEQQLRALSAEHGILGHLLTVLITGLFRSSLDRLTRAAASCRRRAVCSGLARRHFFGGPVRGSAVGTFHA
jgi:hypothetical protein